MRRAAVTLALSLAACGGAPAQPPSADSTPKAHRPLQPLGLAQVESKPPARTTLPVSFAIDRASLAGFVEQFLPQRYGEKGRAVGHGVKLDVEITRGTPSYEVTGDALHLTLPLALSLDVHRKLGPINLALGHCEPRLLASARVFPELSPELTVRTPVVEIALQDRCNLSGFDVSAVIEDEIGQQKQKALGELEKGLKALPLLLSAQAKQFETPLARHSGRCPHLRVERLLQSPLTETQTVFAMTLGVQGSIVDHCDPELASALTVEQRTAAIPFEVATQSLITWETLSRALGPILSKEGLLSSPLRLASARTPQGERVALGITSEQSAGWLLLRPELQGNQLVFVAEESTEPTWLARLAPLLARVALTVDRTHHDTYAQALLERSLPLSQIHLSEPGAEARLTQQARQLRTEASPQLEPTGVAIVFRTVGP